METTQKVKTDAAIRFEEPIHCTQYLVDGELKICAVRSACDVAYSRR